MGADEPYGDARPRMSREEYEEEMYIRRALADFKSKRRRRRIKKVLVTLLVLGVAGGVAVWYVLPQVMPAEEVVDESMEEDIATAEVYRGRLSSTIRAEGITVPMQTSDIDSQVSGTILQVMVSEGAHVQKGDVLFTVTNEEYYGKIRDSEAKVQEANQALAEAREAYKNAYQEYEQAFNAAQAADDPDLFDPNLEQAARDADAAVSRAEQAATDAQNAHNAFLATSGQDSVKSVQAPISGDVMKMRAKVGAKLEGKAASSEGSSDSGGGSDSLIQIVDISQMIVTVQVNEIDIVKVKEGQSVKLTFPALPKVESMGNVQKVADVASGFENNASGMAESSGGVVTYAVTVVIPKPDPQLKMGMTATAEILAEGETEGFIVPDEAIQEGADGSPVVEVLDPATDEPREVPVRVITSEAQESLVEGELQEGDLVVAGSYSGYAAEDDMGDATEEDPFAEDGELDGDFEVAGD